jgi:phytoene desaturase
MKRAVIIGGGLGGLAAALRLQARGWRVTVCERGATFGGKMNVWRAGGYTFDTGPSLITMPWVFAELYAAAGARLEDHVQLEQLHPLAAYRFDDGTHFDYSAGMPEWLDVVRRLERRDVDGFLKFMALGARLYEVSKETFLRRPPLDRPDRRSLRALRRVPLRYGWGNYHRTVAAHFRSPHLRQLYDRYPTYVGSSPYQSPATLAVIPYIEYAFGGWYVKGGLYRIVETLVNLASARGIELRANAPVERIDRNGARVSGVRLADGERIEADVVVMNGDASHTRRLLGETMNGELRPAERSMSGFVMLLGLSRRLPALAHHTVCFSADYRREFEELTVERRFPSDPTVYVNMPSRSDRKLAPADGETLFVMANAPADAEAWDESQLAEARRRVFARLRRSGLPEIESFIAVCDVWTPARIHSRYAMPGGAIYGTHSHGWRHAFLRPPNRERQVKGLYRVGGSTHPGGGTPTVLLSAQITADLIERYE